jgi:hypothetical protein
MHPSFPPFSTKCVKRVNKSKSTKKTVVSQMYPNGLFNDRKAAPISDEEKNL